MKRHSFIGIKFQNGKQRRFSYDDFVYYPQVGEYEHKEENIIINEDGVLGHSFAYTLDNRNEILDKILVTDVVWE